MSSKTQTNKTTLHCVELRTLGTAICLREAQGEEPSHTITGVLKYNQNSTNLYPSSWDEEYYERLTPGVFAESLQERGVAVLWSHNTGQVLGTTRNNTLRLVDNADGLHFEIDLPHTTLGNDVLETVRRGDVDGVSFGMVIREYTLEKTSSGDKTIYTVTVTRADLYEISPVAFPTYPVNELAARSMREAVASKTEEPPPPYHQAQTRQKIELLIALA